MGKYFGLICFVLIFGSIFSLMIYFVITVKRGGRKQLEALTSSGFQVDHLLKGTGVSLAFNDKDRRIAIVYFNATFYYDYSDVRDWNWHWTEENSVRSNNQIHLELKDKDRPLVKTGSIPEITAEHWNSKLGVILNDY